jgi:CubicO group peptidase (beta-lactamase class C family)
MTTPPTAHDLGLMAGTPPTGDALVTLENWQLPHWNRWGFQHVRELIPTARIRPSGEPWQFRREERDLSAVSVDTGAGERAFGELLADTYTDGVLVAQGGRIVFERYLNGLAEDTTHLLMSVSKSVTSAMVGVLVGEGRLDPAAAVTGILPELAGTSFDGCTVRHLLDMRAGTRFDEDYENPLADVRLYEQIYLWRPPVVPELPTDITSYYPMLENDGPHGGPFRYRSILTDLLGWVAERAGGERLPELITRCLWQPMGAEYAADITVDGHGNAMADGGVCCTLRDLARFGRLMLDDGRRGDRPVVPEAWVADTLTPDPDSRLAFTDSGDATDFQAGAYYRNKWWVIDAGRGVYAGVGINGQLILVDGEHDGVVAKLSSWPEAWSSERFTSTLHGCRDLLRLLAAGETS